MAADHFTPQSAVDPAADNANAVLLAAAMLHVTHMRAHACAHIQADFSIFRHRHIFAFSVNSPLMAERRSQADTGLEAG